MAKQTATTRNKTAVAELDLRFGFPGQMPTAGRGRSTERMLKFFTEYVRVGDARKAARLAGYSSAWGKRNSYPLLKKHADYVQWLQAHYAQETAKAVAIDQQTVVDEMAKIALANVQDFVVIERKRAKATVRLKRLDELTRDQMAAIDLTQHGGQLGYKFRDRDGKLFELGKSLGMFNEKVLYEHRHQHLHLVADLSKAPMAALEELEAQFERLLTQEGPTDATVREVPPVRNDQAEVSREGNGAGGGQDPVGQDHTLTRRRRTP